MDDQRHDRKEQHARLQPCGPGVVFLHTVLEAAEQQRHAKHEQRIGDDGARDRRLDQIEHAGAQRGDCDDQFGQVAERGVQQAPDRVAGPGGDAFSSVAEQGGEGKGQGQARGKGSGLSSGLPDLSKGGRPRTVSPTC